MPSTLLALEPSEHQRERLAHEGVEIVREPGVARKRARRKLARDGAEERLGLEAQAWVVLEPGEEHHGIEGAFRRWLRAHRHRFARAQAHILDPDVLVQAMGGGLNLDKKPLPIGGE